MKERLSNIELLRIISIIGVIILHFNNPSIGGGISLVKSNSVNYYILYLLESCFVIAVDVFMIISGYFLINNNKRNIWKPIELIFQVIFFQICKYLIIGFFSDNISIKGIIRSIIPSNYFVILYITVFIISPFINVLIVNLNDKARKKFIIILFLFFSIYPTIVDLISEISKHQFIGLSSIGMYGSQWGYSIINFALCYITGAYLCLYKDLLFKVRKTKLLLCFIINIFIITVWSIINNYIGFYTEKSALEYCNPIIILNAIIIFLLFSKVEFKSNIINKLSKATFTVFLCHSILIRKNIVEFIVLLNPIIMLLSIFLYAIVIYFIFYIVNVAFLILKKTIFKKLEEKIDLTIDI